MGIDHRSNVQYYARAVKPSRGALALALLFAYVLFGAPLTARAGDLRTSYQLGVGQSAGTTLVTNQAEPGAETSAATNLQGVNLTTSAAANCAFDLRTSSLDHALVAGASFGQLVPAGVPGGVAGVLQSSLTTIQGTSQYLARLEQPGYGLAFGGGYALGSNGRIGIGSEGGVEGQGAGQTTLAGTQLGPFIAGGLTHTLNGRGQLQLTRERWDLILSATYAYTNNGVFNLAAPLVPGALQSVPGAGASTNVAAFVRATTQTFTPLVSYRARVGNSGNVSASVQSIYSVPIAGTASTSAAALASEPFPRTLVTNASLSYLYDTTVDRAFGVRGQAIYSLRVPTSEITQLPEEGGAMKRDALIYSARIVYRDLWPWRLRVTAELGAAQPWVYQPPFGTLVPFNVPFETFKGGATPVFSLIAQRFFDPVVATLTVIRDIGIGAFGASAIMNESAALALQYQIHSELPASLRLGVNASERRPIGAVTSIEGLASNNRGVGVNFLGAKRIYEQGDLVADLVGSYNFNWIDPNPDNLSSVQAGVSFVHVVLCTVRVMYGRGPLMAPIGAAMTGPFALGSEGLPLSSTRLLDPNAPMLDNARGARPGLPADEERDSVDAYERSRKQDEIERSTKEQSEEEKKLEEEREERRQKRTREFHEWPMDLEKRDLEKRQQSTSDKDQSDEEPK